MAERDVIKAIQQLLHKRGAYAIKIHGGPYQPKTIDLLVCYRGRFIGIEAKDGKKEPTPLQWQVIREIRDAGGTAFPANSPNLVRLGLDAIDKELDSG